MGQYDVLQNVKMIEFPVDCILTEKRIINKTLGADERWIECIR